MKTNIPIQGDIARSLLNDPNLTAMYTGDEQFLILKSPGRLVRLIEVSSGHASVPFGASEGFTCTQIDICRESPNFTAYAHLPGKTLPANYYFRYRGATEGWTCTYLFRQSSSTREIWEPGASSLLQPDNYHFGSRSIDNDTLRELGFWYGDNGKKKFSETIRKLRARPSRVLKAIGSSNGPQLIRAPRKNLDLPEKDWVGKEDFFGVRGRSVIYYSAREGTLMAFNFSPPW